MTSRILQLISDVREGATSEEGDSGGTDTAGLFECPECGTVYVETELGECPDCGAGVERVPTGQELGLTP